MYGRNRSNHLGQMCLEVLPKTHVIQLVAGVVFYGLDVPCAVMLRVFACLWLGLAIYYGLLRQKVRVQFGLVGIHLLLHYLQA